MNFYDSLDSICMYEWDENSKQHDIPITIGRNIDRRLRDFIEVAETNLKSQFAWSSYGQYPDDGELGLCEIRPSHVDLAIATYHDKWLAPAAAVTVATDRWDSWISYEVDKDKAFLVPVGFADFSTAPTLIGAKLTLGRTAMLVNNLMRMRAFEKGPYAYFKEITGVKDGDSFACELEYDADTTLRTKFIQLMGFVIGTGAFLTSKTP